MKVPLGWLVSWALYWLGGVLYSLHGRVVRASIAVQHWAGCDGPWGGEDEAA